MRKDRQEESMDHGSIIDRFKISWICFKRFDRAKACWSLGVHTSWGRAFLEANLPWGWRLDVYLMCIICEIYRNLLFVCYCCISSWCLSSQSIYIYICDMCIIYIYMICIYICDMYIYICIYIYVICIYIYDIYIWYVYIWYVYIYICVIYIYVIYIYMLCVYIYICDIYIYDIYIYIIYILCDTYYIYMWYILYIQYMWYIYICDIYIYILYTLFNDDFMKHICLCLRTSRTSWVCFEQQASAPEEAPEQPKVAEARGGSLRKIIM